MVARVYRIVLEFDEHGYWVVGVPQLPRAHARARTIVSARERARAAIAALIEQEPSAVEVGEEEFRLPSRLAGKVSAALEARERAERAEADLVVKLRAAAAAAVELTGTRDAAELLGLSHGRIHQLVAYDGARAKPGGPRKRQGKARTSGSVRGR